jgi:hypothetical protein
MRAEYAGWFRQQSSSCRDLGSPLWAAVVDRLADDIDFQGPTLRVLETRKMRFGDAGPLRLMGLAHRMALSDQAQALAATLPSCGGVADERVAADEVVALIAAYPGRFAEALHQAPQTNEVARASGLVLGLLWAQRVFGHPLRLREIGCSGGLNLQMARFRYVHDNAAIGPVDSPVTLGGLWHGDPNLEPLDVADRAGCDPSPIDVSTDAGALWLKSFVWPDQHARLDRLDGAIALARAWPPRLDRTSDTAGWLSRELEAPPALVTTVVFHSIVWQYIDKPDRAHVTAAIESAGSRASADRPLVWMQFEPDLAERGQVAVTLRAWPGDVYVRLATADFHGRWVRIELP